MQKKWLGLFSMLLLGMFAVPARAQLTAPGDAAEESAQPRRYTVELIIFEYTDSGLDSNEVFVPDAGEPEADPAIADELVFTDMPPSPGDAPASTKPAFEQIPIVRQLEMTVLRPDAYSMQNIYLKLAGLDAYKPIMHTAWTQTAVDKEISVPIRLRMLGDAPLRLDGSLTLYLNRYLHLVVDLALDADQAIPVDTTAPDRMPGYGDETDLSEKPDLRPAPVRYRIFEDRIFKNGDLRYFDHPKFGVLAKVTRFEAGDSGQNPVPQDTVAR